MARAAGAGDTTVALYRKWRWAPYPAFATNTLLGMEPQMLMWGSWYEGATGFLYWDMADWAASDPWGPNILTL
jgi:hypothetical protein